MTDDIADSLRPKLVGARVLRVEDPRLLVGKGAYVDDHKIPGTLAIAFRRSDHAHARITGIDTTAAQAMPGVVTVVSASDLEGTFTALRATSRMKNYHATDLLPLAQAKVRYVGEPVVAVIAENRYLAEDAANEVAIDYEPLADLIDAERAAAEDAELLHAESGTNVLAEREFARGDVDAAVEAAAVRVKARFRFHRKTPVALENRVYLADYDDGRRALTLYSSTQVPGIVRDALCDALDIPGHRLRVVAPDVGGGFGGKASLYPEELLVCLLARRLGRPVKWTSDRLEDLVSTSQAFDEIIDAELGLDEDGNLLGLTADVIGDIGAYSIYPWTAVLEPVQVISFMPGPYRLENYRGRVRAVATSKAPGGPYRGVGRPISTFVMERLIDMAARKLKADPKDLRLQNLVRPEEFPYKAASGIVWDRSGFTECLNKTCEAADYDALRREQIETRQAGRWMGIGLASYAELTGIGSRISAAPGMPINTGTETATIRIDSSGAVTAFFGVASHGQGLETSLAQVVAEELGVRLDDVEVVMGDSATMAHGTGTYASRSTVLAGGAAMLSAQAVKENIIKAASHLLEAAETDIEVTGSMVQVIGTDRAMTIRQLARAVYSEMGRFPKELREEISLEATKLYDPFFGTSTSATHLAVVDINPATYDVTVKRYVVSEDCGRLINPLIVDGQVHGGVAQGIGAALMEEVVHDDTGQILTASLVDYVVPSACEIPAIEVHHLESELPNTMGGFRGMGEGGTIGAPAAVANAIADALAPFGIEITEVPVTPERLFRLIEQASEESAESTS